MSNELQRIVAGITGALFTPVFEFLYGEGEVVDRLVEEAIDARVKNEVLRQLL